MTMRFIEVRRPRNNGGTGTIQLECLSTDTFEPLHRSLSGILFKADSAAPRASAYEYLDELEKQVKLFHPLRAFKIMSERDVVKLVAYSEDDA